MLEGVCVGGSLEVHINISFTLSCFSFVLKCKLCGFAIPNVMDDLFI